MTAAALPASRTGSPGRAWATLPAVLRPAARLRVLDVTKWYGETSGGVRTYLDAKAAYVRQRPDLAHTLVIPGSTDAVHSCDGTRMYRLRGPRIPTQQQYRFLLAPRSLRRIIRHERPDVIELGSQLFVPWVVRLALGGRPTPLVSFYHGNLERSLSASVGLPEGAADAVSRTMTRSYLRLVDGLVSARLAASDTLITDLSDAGIGNVTRVQLGVDLDTFHPRRRAARTSIRGAIGIPGDAPAVVYCGRMAPEKDVEWLVRQWPLAGEFTGAWLVMVGEGPLKRQLRALASSIGARIVWLPFESDRQRLADLLASMDACVAPGPVETFGLSALEALACGTPVISVDAGAGAELVRRSGGGVTWRRRDEIDFAATLATFFRMDRRDFGTRGRRHAEDAHAWPQAFDHLFAFYAQLAGRDR